MNDNYKLYEKVIEEIFNNSLNILEAKNKLSNILNEYQVNKIETDFNRYDICHNIEVYLKDKTIQNLSILTIKSYRIQLNVFRKYISEIEPKIQNINKEHILNYFEYLKNKSEIKTSTLESIRYILQGFFNWLKDEGIIKISPMIKIKPFRVDKDVGNSLNIAELELVRDNCETIREKALVELLFSSGMRLSELGNLKIKDIDFINERAIISTSL